MSERKLRVKQVRYWPGGQSAPILDVPQLDCKVSSVTAIVGANGSGKTTLLRCVSGEIAHGGSIVLDNEDKKSTSQTKKLNVYHVVQEPGKNVFTDLTVRENLLLARCFSSSFHWAKVGAVLNQWSAVLPNLNISGKRLTKYFSQGEKQALALVLAFAKNPTVLLLDEHTAALDPRSRRICAEMVKTLFKNCTVLWVSQDFELVREFADSYLVLRAGHVATGTEPLSISSWVTTETAKLCFG